MATIRKELTFLRPRYTVDGPGITVTGDVWNLSFELSRDGAPIGRVDKKWMSLRDRYAVEILEPADELTVLGVVLAIDYAQQQQSAANVATMPGN